MYPRSFSRRHTVGLKQLRERDTVAARYTAESLARLHRVRSGPGGGFTGRIGSVGRLGAAAVGDAALGIGNEQDGALVQLGGGISPAQHLDADAVLSGNAGGAVAAPHDVLDGHGAGLAQQRLEPRRRGRGCSGGGIGLGLRGGGFAHRRFRLRGAAGRSRSRRRFFGARFVRLLPGARAAAFAQQHHSVELTPLRRFLIPIARLSAIRRRAGEADAAEEPHAALGGGQTAGGRALHEFQDVGVAPAVVAALAVDFDGEVVEFMRRGVFPGEHFFGLGKQVLVAPSVGALLLVIAEQAAVDDGGPAAEKHESGKDEDGAAAGATGLVVMKHGERRRWRFAGTRELACGYDARLHKRRREVK